MDESGREQQDSSADRGRRGWPLMRRWIGVCAAVLVLVLCLTGLALNHAEDLRLDSRLLSAPWLLRWYGLNVPDPVSSFDVGPRRVTLLGDRLYLDAKEVTRGIDDLVGATLASGLFVAATPRVLIFINNNAEVVDRWDASSVLPGRIDGVTALSGAPLLSSNSQRFRFDPSSRQITEVAADVEAQPVVPATPVQPELLQLIGQNYRGSGVSVERLLQDVHSGRLMSRAGVVLMDIVAVVLIILAGGSIFLWIRK